MGQRAERRAASSGRRPRAALDAAHRGGLAPWASPPRGLQVGERQYYQLGFRGQVHYARGR
eukprot:8894925-Lingulodinium_polyedra.AAC.1